MGSVTSSLTRRFSPIVIVLAMILAATVTAKADSTYTQDLSGPGGLTQLLTVDYNLSAGSYSLTLADASDTGSDSGTCSALPCIISAHFLGSGPAGGYNELVTLNWDGKGNPDFHLLASAVPEEPVLFEVVCSALMIGMLLLMKRETRSESFSRM